MVRTGVCRISTPNILGENTILERLVLRTSGTDADTAADADTAGGADADTAAGADAEYLVGFKLTGYCT